MNKDNDNKSGGGEGRIADGGHGQSWQLLLHSDHPHLHVGAGHLDHQVLEDGGEGGEV